MDTNGICRLLGIISIHYPKMKEHFINADGKMNKNVVDEWHRCIGYMDYEEALKKFDTYLKMSEGNKFAPDVKFFMSKSSSTAARKEVHYNTKHKWHLDKYGRLFDEEDREYANPALPNERYYYDEMGRICQKGRVVIA